MKMDEHVIEFFSQKSDEIPHGNFHKVIALHEMPNLSLDSLDAEVPDLCRGWRELAKLPSNDRVQFIREYWFSVLPYKPNIHDSLSNFFTGLDDLGVFLVQKKYDDPFQCCLVYSLHKNKGFFIGEHGAVEKEVGELQQLFPDHIIPEDYLAFLKIHNGFRKSIDTGVLSIPAIRASYERLQSMFEEDDPILLSDGTSLDPATLIPFYESFGMPVFQCFWSEWYPEQEMGNVYFSKYTRTLADGRKGKASPEQLAFPTFLDWLCFYLETVE